MAAPTKAPITCHILDQTVGLPAANVRVRLELTSPPRNNHPSSLPIVFESTTDDDGRIMQNWLPYSSPQSSGEVPVYTLEDVLGDIPGKSRWTLRFDTGAYFAREGKETFFPEVVVVFEVAEAEGRRHYHVPLLLSPFGYSTYRGS